MKTVFIPTKNYNRFQSLVADLINSTIGVEMAPVIGRAGRGKTTAALRLVANNPDIKYIRYEGGWTTKALMQEVAFKLTGSRLKTTQKAREAAKSALLEKRRVLLIDEADRLSVNLLNCLRDFHDICAVPIILIGEKDLLGRLATERRLKDRCVPHLSFEPVGMAEIIVLYRHLFEQDIEKPWAMSLHRHSENGEFRLIMRDAQLIDRKMKASGLEKISEALVKDVCKG
jgi:hypothetical protein